MRIDYSEQVKASFSRWFIILFLIGGIVLLLILAVCIFKVIQHPYGSNLLKAGLLFVVMVGEVYFLLKVICYSVTATEKGIETYNIVGSTKKIILWDSIVEVRGPRFGIPKDAGYIITKNREKVLLVKSMKNYGKLIEVIRSRAQNLERCES